jgi:hypothetical protein
MAAKKTLQEVITPDKYDVNDNGCWVWNRYIGPGGYGQVAVLRKTSLAHRVMFQAHKGDIPNGLVVMHTCDNRLCVNPEHLSLGTQGDNVRDCVAKGRGRGQFGQAGKLSTAIRDFATGRYTQGNQVPPAVAAFVAAKAV